MYQPNEVDEAQDKLFDDLLRQAYQELERMEPKKESYESYVKAEMADHQYKEPRYRRQK